MCGCLTLRVGNHKMKPPDKKKIEEFKKQFQTSNFSANEYMKWKRSGGPEIERLSVCMAHRLRHKTGWGS